MKPEVSAVHEPTLPWFTEQAAYLNTALRSMSEAQLARLMGISDTMARVVKQQITAWQAQADGSPAALTFRGDIYSGLAAAGWSADDAAFAQEHLLILSGLYGLLRPFDAIKPYRLEMGYKLELDEGLRLDGYWQKELANALDSGETYVNLTANEYFRVIQKQLNDSIIVSPKFLTMSPKKHAPVFVTVHAKIARGSFANWLITNKIDNLQEINHYDQLGYVYDKSLSTEREPVFVCRKFGGLGLSVRLK